MKMAEEKIKQAQAILTIIKNTTLNDEEIAASFGIEVNRVSAIREKMA